jgi:hypothetical protein
VEEEDNDKALINNIGLTATGMLLLTLLWLLRELQLLELLSFLKIQSYFIFHGILFKKFLFLYIF